jgi:hypothetical protein
MSDELSYSPDLPDPHDLPDYFSIVAFLM